MTEATLHIGDTELAHPIEGGESERIEFKETLQGSAPDRVREAVCAFANDLPGAGKPGTVIVGVKDSGESSGLHVTDKMLRQLNDIKTDGNIVPPPTLLVERRHHEGGEIALVTVLPSDSPPVRCKGAIHVRNGPRKSIASAQEERILNEKRLSQDRIFDVSPVPGTNVDDLSRRQFEEEYLPHAIDREALEVNERTLEERLAATKMIASVGDQRATILGLLVIGIRPLDFIPGSYVQFLRIADTELSGRIVDEDTIDGTIPDILRRLDDKIRSHNRHRIDLVSNDLENRTETYPLAALQQLMRNAIMHRTYENTHAPVRITWFDDRIEIQNPGGPFSVVTRENFARPGFTDYRNPNLAEAMKVLGYVQRFGVGIQTAQHLLREAHHTEAEFMVEQMHVLATIKSKSQENL